MAHGDKTIAVFDCMQSDINMPTKEVISMVKRNYNLDVSERQVQRVRKQHKEKFEGKTEDQSNEKDMGTYMKNKNSEVKGMLDWEIELLNYANEGAWSIQLLAEKLDKTVKEVADVISENHYMIHAEVYDENNADVFFDPKSYAKDSNIPSTFVGDGTNTSRVVPRTVPEEDFWEVKIDCVDSCGKIDKNVNVFMNKESRTKAMLYMKWAGAREWLAYLIGEKKEDGYYISDLYLPDQRTSATLVDKVVADKYNKMTVVGVIHSHHDMGAGDADNPSFSGHDRAFINGNHNLSLLAGNKVGGGFQIVGIARSQTPCGSMVTVKADVKAMVEVDTVEDALKNEFMGKVFDNKTNIHKPGSGVTTVKNGVATRNGKVIESGQYGFSDRYPVRR